MFALKSAVFLLCLFSYEAYAATGLYYKDVYGATNYNGQVTLSDSVGNSQSAVSNPTGANISLTKSTVTQPPVVVVQVQATSGNSGMPFNYIDHCYVFTTTDNAGNPSSIKFIGAGKIDASNNFTGLMGYFGGGGSYYNGGGQVLAMLTNSGFAGVSTYGSGNPMWCGSNASCAWAYAYMDVNIGTQRLYVVAVAAMPTTSVSKCYP